MPKASPRPKPSRTSTRSCPSTSRWSDSAIPGDEFRNTRHNVGAEVVEILAARHGARLKVDKKLRARLDTVAIGGRRIALAIPLTYMNDSGVAVAPLVRRLEIEANPARS